MKNKKLLFLILSGTVAVAYLIAHSVTYALTVSTVPQGGTGNGSYPPNSIIVSGTTPTSAFQATSSITVNTITATSTTATSTLPNLKFTNGQGTSLSLASNARISGLLSVTGVGTSTFSGGASAVGLASSNGLTITSGSLLNASTASSTFLGGINLVGLSSSQGLTVTGTATSTFSNGLVLTSGCIYQNGACLSASGSGTVTSIVFGAGLQGGTITTSGNVAIALSYNPFTAGAFVASSSATSTIAKGLVVGDLLYGSTIIATSSLIIPTASAPSPTAVGQIVINTTAASSSIREFDGTAIRTFYDQVDKTLIVASSTLAYMGAYSATGSTTLAIWNPYRPVTVTSIFCKSDNGTGWVGIGNGTATTTEVNCTQAGAYATISSNNTFIMRKTMYTEIGTFTGAPSIYTITVTARETAD